MLPQPRAQPIFKSLNHYCNMIYHGRRNQNQYSLLLCLLLHLYSTNCFVSNEIVNKFGHSGDSFRFTKQEHPSKIKYSVDDTALIHDTYPIEISAKTEKITTITTFDSVPSNEDVTGSTKMLSLSTKEPTASKITERIIKRIESRDPFAPGAGGSNTWEAFQRAEANWSRLKLSKAFKYDSETSLGADPHTLIDPPAQFVTADGSMGNPACWEKLRRQCGKDLDFDVVVCGGTLGIFFATALQVKGKRVCVIEGGKLMGREQEWNISFDELMELVNSGVLSMNDVNEAITTEFPSCRNGIKNKEVSPLKGGYFDNGIGFECYTTNVLNLGVSPAILVERAVSNFVSYGGIIRQHTRLAGVAISDLSGVALDIGDKNEPITSRLVIDCMGNASPISRQQRYGLKPDGVCVVVGTCASGYDKITNVHGDLLYTFSKAEDKGENGQLQYFWESFPVGIGRNGTALGESDIKTTYMFTYMDAHEKRPSLELLMEDYFRLLPQYQPSIKNPETDLDIKRVLFGYFPTYTDSPLKPKWSRVLAVGDASGIQSPLSFGGFGALTRHIGRISTAVNEALDDNLLHKKYLGQINAYTPNLSAKWMMQRAMSFRMEKKQSNPDLVNRLLAVNFEVMHKLGRRTIQPFLRDILRFDCLVKSLFFNVIKDPTLMPQFVAHVGVSKFVNWLGHVFMMGLYGFLDMVFSPILRKALPKLVKDPRSRYTWRRRMDAWKYGSGHDYIHSKLCVQ